MATANFKTPEYFPLIAAYFYSWDDLYQLEDHEIEDSFLTEEDLDDLTMYVDDFNDDLQFFKVSILDGYYEGLQLFVDFKDSDDFFKYPVENDDDYDVHYYGFDTAEELMNAFYSEQQKVNDFLMEMKNNFRMMELEVAYRFSNGETGYNIK